MLPALASVLNRLNASVERAAREHYWAAIATVLAYVAAVNGVWHVPNHDYRDLAQRFFGANTGGDYIQRDLLLPLLAHVLHATAGGVFEALCLLVLIGALLWLARGLRQITAPRIALLLFAVMVSHPVMTVLLSWLGMPDVFTFAASVVGLLAVAPGALGATAALAIVNHPLAMFALPMIAGLRALGGDRIRGTQLVAVAAGLAVGTVALVLLLAHWGIAPESRLGYSARVGIRGWIAEGTRVAPIAVWSMHGGAWPAIIVAAVALWPARRRYVIGFLAITVVSCGLAFVSHDTTRILSLLTWAPAAHLLLTFARDEDETTLSRVLLVLTLLALASPRLYVWQGVVVSSPFGQPLRSLL